MEAEKRGLSNLRTTPDCMDVLLDEKNREMLKSMGVYANPELVARNEILADLYCNTVIIEARTMIDMARRQILPAVGKYIGDVAYGTNMKKQIIPQLECEYEVNLVSSLTDSMNRIDSAARELEEALSEASGIKQGNTLSLFLRDNVIARMGRLRKEADEAEKNTAASYWPFPEYGDLFYGF